MHLAKGPSRLKPAVSLLILTAVLALGSLTLTQCRMVGDQLTGVKVDPSHNRPANDCTRQCKLDLEKALEAEYRLLITRTRACSGNRACLRAELEAHFQRVAEIWRQYKTCINGCHNQGGGTGG